MSPFTAKTPAFEGPLEVLLNLIEARKLHVGDIALASVADDFIAYARQFEEFPVAEGASFILVASTLLLIKSKSLLPALELTEEEKTDISELEARLAFYQKVRGYAGALRALFGKKMLFPVAARERAPLFMPDARVTLAGLAVALQNILMNLPRAAALPKVVVEKVMSLDEMITRLTGRIQGALRLGFRDFANAGAKAKKEIIVSFLAMLELVRRGAIRVTQEKHFDDILMETEQVGVPKYQ
ncbi:MAG: Segregation and condensation protein A [Parcubacteria group bacterium GW2011_GWA2_47_12]|nr:MAG: Segregation and condensation protein A [Parcubacteria group bacterium GW2011_GWA2_47_12]